MKISIQVIKVYHVETDGGDTRDPSVVKSHLADVESWQSTRIEAEGKLMDVSTGDAAIIGPSSAEQGTKPRTDTEAVLYQLASDYVEVWGDRFTLDDFMGRLLAESERELSGHTADYGPKYINKDELQIALQRLIDKHGRDRVTWDLPELT